MNDGFERDRAWNSGRDPARDAEDSDGVDRCDATDRMLARAVAGDAEAIAAIRARGASDPALLEEFMLWQADELRRARAARELDMRADRSEVPAGGLWRSGRAGLGWAVAAVLAVVLVGQAAFPRSAPQKSGTPSVAGLGGFATSDDAFDAYVTKAREEGVLEGEIAPPTLLRSRELADGRGFEVIIVRQVIERRVAPQMFRVAPTGETGRLRPVQIRPRTDSVQ
ncbi:MAG: hypothetical protein ACO31E_01540 [Phycisphaerales bacterium]